MKTVIFDMHGVIMKDPSAKFMPFINRTFPHKTEDDVYPMWIEAGFGRLTSLECLRMIGYEGDLNKIERDYLDTLEIDEDFVPCATALRRNCRLAILSNDISDWSLYIRRKYNLDELFDAIVISGDVGLKKPSRDIYRLMLEKLGQPGDECVFIDDRLVNLPPAEALGIETVLFDRGAFAYEGYGGKRIAGFDDLREMLGY